MITNNNLTNIDNKLDEISNKLTNTGSIIKSIQRGTIASGTADISITINEVNPDKCFVVINSSISSQAIGDDNLTYTKNNTSILKSLTTNTLTVSPNNGGGDYFSRGYANGTISWQVIEFA